MPGRAPTRLLVPAQVIAVALTLYGLFMVAVRAFAGAPPVLILATATFVPLGAGFALWFRRRPEDQLRWGHPFIFLVALLAATRDVLEISSEQTLDVLPLTLLTLGAAVVMLDRRWYAAVLTIVGASWGAALLLAPGQPDAGEATLSIVSAMVVGLVMHLAMTSIHRRRDEAVARMHVILDAIGAVGQGYMLTDGRRVLEINDAYLQLARRTREEVLAVEDIIEWTPEEDRAALRARLQQRRAGQHVPDHYEARMIRGDGTILDIEVSVKPISTSPMLIFSIVRDISERKHEERQALEAQAMRDKVTAGLSHDLRSPLTAVIGFSELLQDAWERLEHAERALMLEQITANARELEEMIDELLDFSRLEHGWSEIRPQRTPIRLWLEEWIRAKAPWLSEHRIELDVAEHVRIDADPRALARIVGNLVSNATKFAPAGSTITIGARTTSSGAELWVRDHGPGISADVLPRIFDPFTQGMTPRSSKGIGMGLAVVSRYVALHGGGVDVRSEPGGGATFTVTLPHAVADDTSDRFTSSLR